MLQNIKYALISTTAYLALSALFGYLLFILPAKLIPLILGIRNPNDLEIGFIGVVALSVVTGFIGVIVATIISFIVSIRLCKKWGIKYHCSIIPFVMYLLIIYLIIHFYGFWK